MSLFARLSPRLQQAIVARLGWSSLRPVQELAGEALLDGCNAVVLAPTAGGKTEAAMFPVLSSLMDDPAVGVGAIYVAPIKALLNNQADRLGLYTEMVGLGRFVWHGDTPSHERAQFLREPAELLMTTPESLEVMLVSPRVDAKALFGDLRVIVIDEVHAISGCDRGAHLMSIIERLQVLSKHDLQRVGLSATIGNPEAIGVWLQGTSKRPSRVVDPPKQPARRQLRVEHRDELVELAELAAHSAKGAKSLFFCQTRALTEAVAEHMRRVGTNVFVHHSAVSREERQLAEEQFNRGSDACIVCTSTLELGIDVGDLDRVMQAEAPATVGSFLQRMGRTGRRAGQAANTTFYCQSSDGVLQAIALIELAKAGWVEDVGVEDRCWPVLIHQLLALALANDGVTAEDVWVHLERVPDFRGIHRAEFDRLVAWMLRDQSMILTSGRLVLGPKAERRYGRKNFMELYAVFSSPQTYAVETSAGRPLGTLNQDFVDRLVDAVSCFLLGGRAWTVARVIHDERRVLVAPAPRGQKPTWGGFLPQFLGFRVCQQILSVLTSGESYGYLTAEAATVLSERRAAMEGVLQPGRGGVEYDQDGEIRWWTFAGGRVNATLRYALEAVGQSWKVVTDNFVIKIRGEELTRAGFDDALVRFGELEFWEDESVWQAVGTSLPNYRLSKFQPLMPPWIEREVVGSYLLDLAGAWQFAAQTEAVGVDLPRAPVSIRVPTEADERSLEAAEPESPVPPRDESRPLVWVATADALAVAVADLESQSVVGLDVETTLRSRALCLVQLATSSRTFIVDALNVPDLAPLAGVLGNPGITKVIHNAAFERSVLARYELPLDGVIDTLVVSRDCRGRAVAGGHGLKAVCDRELGVKLDKSWQTSDWTRRPLAPGQLAYAAVDAEVLLRLREHFGSVT